MEFCIQNKYFQWTVMPFGLKTAPSLFQKAMIKNFQPIMDQALVYIDDILLYSPDQESHAILLERFMQIILEKGIMLSERKMQTNKEEIEFLGMTIKDERYQPHPSIAEELKKFPDSNLSQKQVQQFLGIVNYLGDFIPSEGKRILQTDASDKYWGAILFEEDNGKRHLCGYKNGRFNDAEIHYHSTFKETLAIKNGISKFQFHLTGYRFLVEMDMSSFPKMLQFKQKEVPHPQLLRWAKWFSKFTFDVVYIKGKHNVLADILSRPPKFSAQVHHPVEVFMFQPSSSKEKGKKKTQQPPSPFSLPYQPNCHPDHPPEFHTEDLQYYVTMATQEELSPEMKNFATFLKWFYPLEQWHEMIGLEYLKNMKAQWMLRQALVEYQTNIPDPKEWSQEYPMYCSQAVQDTSAWRDIQEDTSSWKEKDVYKTTKTSIIPIHDMIPPNDLEIMIEQQELKCHR
ncbi:hypothetical protein Gotri_026544, partial [Gossypium trilobum]|nr:hypothetical protein [Gossypium trilobum]